MSEHLKHQLDRASREIRVPPRPDIDRLVRKGGRLRALHFASIALSITTVTILGVAVGVALTGSTPTSPEPATTAPSSHTLAFAADGNAGQLDIFVARPDGSDAINITDDPLFNGQPAWSPDGSRIAFIEEEEAGSIATLHVMNSDGTGDRVLVNGTGSETQPEWSPDGKSIAYVKNTGGTPSIHVVETDGSNDQVLVNMNGVAEAPSWSPTGDRIAFAANVGENQEIFTVDPDGSNLERLTQNEDTDAAPEWSPDGNKIVFLRLTPEGAGEIHLMEPDGSGDRPLAKTGSRLVGPTWNPTGDEVVFSQLTDAGWTLRAVSTEEGMDSSTRSLRVQPSDPLNSDYRS
jgi:Tol biopolymer transport system component